MYSNFKAMNSIYNYNLHNMNNSLFPYFINFENDLFGINLITYDSLFMFPVFIFFTNYLFLKTSSHPWIISYRYNMNKKRRLIYLSFFVSLFSITWPKVYKNLEILINYFLKY